jgi:WD40 repeat protein
MNFDSLDPWADDATAPSPIPYPGLRTFQEADAVMYFGRGETVDELLRRLERNRFLVVVGPNGAGKASLLQAGLFPALDAGNLAGASRRWWRVHLRLDDSPTAESPLTELADAVWRASHAAQHEHAGEPAMDHQQRVADLRFLEATLRASDLGLVRALLDQGFSADTDAVIWIERADALVRPRARRPANSPTPHDDAQALVDLLLAAARQTQRRIHVILTMRAESLDSCARFTGLAEAVNAGLLILPRMSRAGLRDAIEGPLERFGATWEPDFVAALLNDVEGQTDPLQRMQHALAQTWRRAAARASRSPVHLTRDDYLAVGGFHDSIARQAREIVSELRGRLAELRNTTDDVAVRSQPCRVGDVVRAIRALLSRADSQAASPHHSVSAQAIQAAAEASWEETRAVIARFAQEDCGFLLHDALDGDSILPETRVSLAHESLIRLWPEPLEVRTMNSPASVLSESTGNTALGSIRTTAGRARNKAELGSDERRERIQQRLRARRGRWWPLVAAWICASAVLAALGIAHWWINDAREDNLRQRIADQPSSGAKSVSRSAPSRTPSKIGPKSVATARKSPALESTATPSDHSAEPIPATVATNAPAAENRSPESLPQRTERLARAERLAGISATLRAQNPIASLTLAAESTIRLRRDDPLPTTIEQALRDALAHCSGRALAGHREPARVVAISDEGRWAVTAADTVRLWDLSQEFPVEWMRELVLPNAASLRDAMFARFSPDSKFVSLVSRDGRLWTWSLVQPEAAPLEQEFSNVALPIRQVAARPGSNEWATCDANGAVVWWSLDPQQPAALSLVGRPVCGGGVRTISFDRKLPQLLTAGGLVQVWGMSDDSVQLRRTLVAPMHFEFRRATISESGRWIAASDVAQNVFLWDCGVSHGKSPTSPRVYPAPRRAEGRSGDVTSLKFDPRERWLACAATDRSVHVWRLEPALAAGSGTTGLADADSTTWVLTHPADVHGLATSGDGNWLFSHAADGAIRAWTMPPVDALSVAVAQWQGAGFDSKVDLASSPDAGVLAALDADGQVRIWDRSRLRDIQGQFATPSDHRVVGEWSWSPKGERAAALMNDGKQTAIVVWRAGGDDGWFAETALALPPSFLPTPDSIDAFPPQLRFDAAGESVLAISAAETGAATPFALWRLPPTRDPPTKLSTWDFAQTSQPAALQLRERFLDLKFGARWLLLVNPAGKMRVWSHEDATDEYVERSLPAHPPAREVFLSPGAGRLAVIHQDSSRGAAVKPAVAGAQEKGEQPGLLNSHATYTLSLWGPEPGGEPWTQRGFWEIAATPTRDPRAADVVLTDRWLIARGVAEDGESPILRGWRIDNSPPLTWTLNIPGLERFRVSSDGSRLMIDSVGAAQVYALGNAPEMFGRADHQAVAGSGTTWSADGRWLVVASSTGSLGLWDLGRAGAARSIRLDAPTSSVDLVFDRRGETLFGLHRSGYIRQWNVASDLLPGLARRAAGRNLTNLEWEAAFANDPSPYLETFAGLGPGLVATPRAAEAGPRPVVAARPDEEGAIRVFIESLPQWSEGKNTSSHNARQLVAETWKAWGDVGSIAFREVGRDEQPHLVIRTEPLDGAGGVPGHGQLGPPQEGLTLELRLDSHDEWSADQLRRVVLHELGHLLGLTHTATPGQLMSDSVPASVRAPQPEDIARLRKLWNRGE